MEDALLAHIAPSSAVIKWDSEKKAINATCSRLGKEETRSFKKAGQCMQWLHEQEAERVKSGHDAVACQHSKNSNIHLYIYIRTRAYKYNVQF